MRNKRIVALALTVVIGASLVGTSQASTVGGFDFCKKICINMQNIICGLIPNLPELPEVPNKPEIPEVPEYPENPGAPEAPDVPIVPDAPGTNINAHAYEARVLELVNEERAKHGLAALSWSNELAEVARAHSKDMATRNFFSHNNPDGKTPFDRIQAAGIGYRTAGENIAAGQSTPEEVVTAWMNSEGHRANILNLSYTQLGVGYVTGNGSYKTYWTQNFIG